MLHLDVFLLPVQNFSIFFFVVCFAINAGHWCRWNYEDSQCTVRPHVYRAKISDFCFRAYFGNIGVYRMGETHYWSLKFLMPKSFNAVLLQMVKAGRGSFSNDSTNVLIVVLFEIKSKKFCKVVKKKPWNRTKLLWFKNSIACLVHNCVENMNSLSKYSILVIFSWLTPKVNQQGL